MLGFNKKDPELVEDEEFDLEDIEEIDLPDFDPTQFEAVGEEIDEPIEV